MFPDSRTAWWPCSGPGIDGVAVQVDVPLNSSADESVLLPVDEPPATRTCPFATMLFGSSVMLWPTRGEVIVPADDQVPLLTLGSNTIARREHARPVLAAGHQDLAVGVRAASARCAARAGGSGSTPAC